MLFSVLQKLTSQSTKKLGAKVFVIKNTCSLLGQMHVGDRSSVGVYISLQ